MGAINVANKLNYWLLFFGGVNMSKGEEKVAEILRKHKKPFRREYIFKDLKTYRGGKPRFDFAILREDGSIEALIEYDGILHFKDTSLFTKKDFQYRQEMDLLKNSYCLLNDIPLYRIPYYDFNNLKTLDDIMKKKYLVITKWHNHIIRQDLIASGKFEKKLKI